MNLAPVSHPHVNEYVLWPDKLTLFFSGSVNASIPLWSWALMDATDLYASDRGHESVKTEKTHIWAATVGLGKGLAFLDKRKWSGYLTIKSHLRDCLIFSFDPKDRYDPLIKRCVELLCIVSKKHDTMIITGDENEFCRSLCLDAYKEYGR